MRRLIPISILAALFFGCAGPAVRRDYDASTDFGRLKTYAWGAPSSAGPAAEPADTPFVQERIRNAVDQTLQRKGYRKVPAGTADFLVVPRYAIERKENPDQVSTGIGLGMGSGGGFGGISVGIGGGANEERETLTLDLVDPTDGGLIWRGWTERQAAPGRGPEKSAAGIAAMSREIFSEFPPGARRGRKGG